MDQNRPPERLISELLYGIVASLTLWEHRRAWLVRRELLEPRLALKELICCCEESHSETTQLCQAGSLAD